MAADFLIFFVGKLAAKICDCMGVRICRGIRLPTGRTMTMNSAFFDLWRPRALAKEGWRRRT
jgi:hypothetical protein